MDRRQAVLESESEEEMILFMFTLGLVTGITTAVYFYEREMR
jgi:hypothetical protein